MFMSSFVNLFFRLDLAKESSVVYKHDGISTGCKEISFDLVMVDYSLLNWWCNHQLCSVSFVTTMAHKEGSVQMAQFEFGLPTLVPVNFPCG